MKNECLDYKCLVQRGESADATFDTRPELPVSSTALTQNASVFDLYLGRQSTICLSAPGTLTFITLYVTNPAPVYCPPLAYSRKERTFLMS